MPPFCVLVFKGGVYLKGTDILRRAEKYVDQAIQPEDAVDAINEAIDKLCDMGLIYDSTTIIAGSSQAWYPLPDDMTSLVDVTDNAGEAYSEFQQRGAQIRFGDAGVYIIGYRKQPSGITDITQTPPLHVSYHDVLCTYLKGWAKMVDDDESPDGMRLLAQFENEAAKVFSILRRKRGPGRWTVVRAARVG